MSSEEERPLLGPSGSINDHEQQKPTAVYIKPLYTGSQPALLWLNGIYVKFRQGFSLKLFLMLCGMVTIGTANRVAFKIMTNSTLLRVDGNGQSEPKYSTFIAQVTNFIYMPVFWPIVWYFMAYTKRITPQMRAFPIWKYIVMGSLDSLAGILMVCGGAGTSGPLQQLLIQAAIPFTMFFTFAVGLGFVVKIFGPTINVRYRWTHLVGAALIVRGIVLALIPKFTSTQADNQTKVGFAIMFFLAVIPTAFSNVFKEIAFKGADLDIYLVNAWVATFQFLIGFPLLPIGIVVKDNPLQALKALPKEFLDGMLCFVGQGPDGDLCVQRLVMVHILVYLFLNIFYNIFLLSVLKYGSASLLQISSALLLPLANIVFTIGPIMNEFPPRPPQAWLPEKPFPPGYVAPPKGASIPPAVNPPDLNHYSTKLSGYDIGALFLILGGLAFYRALSESPDPQPDNSTVSASPSDIPDPDVHLIDDLDHVPINKRDFYAQNGIDPNTDHEYTALSSNTGSRETLPQ